MTEVRAGVDDVDRQVVALLKRRFGYMDAAARIKPDRSAVRDEWRKADVLAKVDDAAAALGVDRSLMARLYEDLIETSIAHELEVFDRTRGLADSTAALGGFLNPLPLVGGHADSLGALSLAGHRLPLADFLLGLRASLATGAAA